MCGSTTLDLGRWYRRAVDPANTDAFRFVQTKILSAAAVEGLTKGGYEFATIEDAATAVMKIVSDPSINGEPISSHY